MTTDPSLLGSKFAPYGKDGCAGIKPAEDQSDNSAMSTTGRRRGNMVNRVNSTDNQCFFEGGNSMGMDSHGHSRSSSRAGRIKESHKKRSRSTDHINNVQQHTELNSMSIRKMLRPVHTAPDSPVTSPENARHHNSAVQSNTNTLSKKSSMQGGSVPRRLEKSNSSGGGCMSEPEFFIENSAPSHHSRPSKARSEQRINGVPINGYNVESSHNHQVISPTSEDDVDIFDSHCFATTPSSSNASDVDEPASPTSQLLMEYEDHLRNTLEKDSESYSLHTFEALLGRSMENLEQELHNLGPDFNPKASFLKKRAAAAAAAAAVNKDKAWTLGNGNRLKKSSLTSGGSGGSGNREKQMPVRPRSVNSALESKPIRGSSNINVSGGNKILGYATLGNDRTNNGTRSFHDNSLIGNGSSNYARRDMKGEPISSGYLSDHETKLQDMVQQLSVESQDSRFCYLTSSEISDDERMSLTTAISDDEIDRSSSPVSTRPINSAASFNCTGAVRKAGFLSVKKWLIRKKHKVELARKRGWKGYWVCLKGTTLLFYPCESKEGQSVEATPRHLIIVDGSIMQAIPEHPKRDFIFCLSTAFGDAYLFQAPCQIELEEWINSIHSACAAAFARHRGKTGTLHLLQEEIYRLEKGIESTQKLKHMAELQISVVTNDTHRSQILAQIRHWEDTLERMHCEQFRLRCYMASLQNGELPNPKGVLCQVNQTTKAVLNLLGVFTVSSFHAYICARSPSLLSNLLAGRGASRKRSLPSNQSLESQHNTGSVDRQNSLGMSVSKSFEDDEDDFNESSLIHTRIPGKKIVKCTMKKNATVEDFLNKVCLEHELAPSEHFLRVKKKKEMPDSKFFVPQRSDLLDSYAQSHEIIEIFAKTLYQLELNRLNVDTMWGFSIEAELVENKDKQDELCCFVSRVEERSVASGNGLSLGLMKGDEIMVINGAIVSDLDMMFIESVLQEELTLCMMLRSSRPDPPPISTIPSARNVDMIESLVCPPPPTDNSINEDAISSLIVPAPGKPTKELHSPDGDSTTAPPSQSSEQSEVKNKVDFVLNPLQITSCSDVGSPPQTPSVKKIKKVLSELIETEQKYVKDLQFLLAAYLEPLKKEHFWNYADLEQLYKNVKEIFIFQTKFLRILEESLESDPGFCSHTSLAQFKSLLMAIGTAFLYNVDEFKIYSTYCANHSKAQKALHQSADNYPFQEFLASCNPNQQQAHTLESFLIKPIQRILKYPLLLQQLKALAQNPSEEQNHLNEALGGMENVAEHINEMQRIHEEYGAIFDHLYRQYQRSTSQLHELNPGDLLYYGGVEWLNISGFLGKIKKGLELHAMCFIFRTAVVFLCKERLRSKRKQLLTNTTKGNPAEVEIIRYQALIPVGEVQVKAGAVVDTDGHYTWELIQLKTSADRPREKSYHLSNSTPEFRNAFLKTIRQIIRDSVRRMSLPSTMTVDTVKTVVSSGTSSYNNRGICSNNKRELEICSETDSTNECSDFKSELDDELEGDPNQQRLQSTVVPSSVGSGSTGAGSSQSVVSASGQDRVPAGQGVPRKSSGGGRKNTRVVFV